MSQRKHNLRIALRYLRDYRRTIARNELLERFSSDGIYQHPATDLEAEAYKEIVDSIDAAIKVLQELIAS